MAKITRKNQRVFAGEAVNTAQYGSAREGTFTLSDDPDVIQALGAWTQGIATATISGVKLPALEESQGIYYVLSRQIAYTLQEGIPEWCEDAVYYEFSIVKKPGTVELYYSIDDENQGNELPVQENDSYWYYIGDLANLIGVKDNYSATTSPTATDDATQGYSEGSKWYNSVTQDIYLCVDSTIGAAVWVNTGINLDDLGSAAFVDTGTGSGQVPLNSNLGSAAYVNTGAAAGDVPVLDSNGLIPLANARKIAGGQISAGTGNAVLIMSSIPSWVRKIEIGLVGITTAGSGEMGIRFLAGGSPIGTYQSNVTDGSDGGNSTTFLLVRRNNNQQVNGGSCTLMRIGASNTWSYTMSVGVNSNRGCGGGGGVTGVTTLEQLQLVSPSTAFSGGFITYEATG